MYNHELKKELYIDKERTLNNIFAERTSELKKVLGNGNIENWHGRIKYIKIKEEGVELHVSLSCNARLESRGDLIIKVATPLYEILRGYHENSEITFSGNFLICSNNAKCDFHDMYYREKSFTQSGSMDEPEFLFQFKEMI